MNKEFEDINAMLDTRSAELQKMKSDRMKQIKQAGAKYHEIEKKLDTVETAEEFVRLQKELKEQENLCCFLTSHKNREPKYNLTKAEHKEICEKVSTELESLRLEYAPKIAKALETVIAIADEYSEQAEFLENIQDKSTRLATNLSSNVWRVQDIADTVEDPLNYIHGFYRSYFPARATVCKAKKSLNAPFGKPTAWMDSETLKVYNYLLSQKQSNEAKS